MQIPRQLHRAAIAGDVPKLFALALLLAGSSFAPDAWSAEPAAPQPHAAAHEREPVNGTENSINRGIAENTGWDPPMVSEKDLKTISIDDFCRRFRDAAKYKAFFIAAGKKYQLNPTLIAAIAMEESHCD